MISQRGISRLPEFMRTWPCLVSMAVWNVSKCDQRASWKRHSWFALLRDFSCWNILHSWSGGFASLVFPLHRLEFMPGQNGLLLHRLLVIPGRSSSYFLSWSCHISCLTALLLFFYMIPPFGFPMGILYRPVPISSSGIQSWQ